MTTETFDAPAVYTKKAVAKKQAAPEEEAQVIVHCIYPASGFDEKIRIWKTTYLCDRDSAHRSKLLFADNISLYPVWTPLETGKRYCFTLIFSALPKSCKLFDLYEEIMEPGGFEVRGIRRNGTDVYTVFLE